jgi:hypothetical protein
MALVTRTSKGSPLTHAELDANLSGLADGTLITAAEASVVSFTQSGSGAVSRTVQAKLRDFVSVKDFGAVGDGSTDDTSAIQAAMDTGNPVYFPPGTYKTTATLLMSTVAGIGQKLYGAGAAREDNGTGTNVTIIQPTSAVSVALGLVAAGGISLRGWELADFSIDMTNMTDASTRIGVRTNDAWSARIKNLTFLNQGTNKRCFKFEEGSYLTVIENCRGTIVEMLGVSLADAVTTLFFLNCDFDQYRASYAASISVVGGAIQGTLNKVELLTDIEGFNITHCDIEGTGTFLNVGTNVDGIVQHSNYFGGFSGTFSAGTWDNDGALFYRETNSWTPVMTFGGASTGITYFNQGASATREGNRVHVTLDFIIDDNGTATGAAAITGLPYAGSASFNQDFAINVNNGTLTGQLFGRIAPSATQITLFVTNNGATAAADETNITNSCTMRAVFTYMVD